MAPALTLGGTAMLLALVALAVLGAFLIITGRWPRRRGYTPYCKRCGYNLTGLDLVSVLENKCPECGTVSGPATVVFGDRIIRQGRLFAGLACFLIGFIPLVLATIGLLGGVDWYQYKPTSWILSDLQHGNAGLAQVALNEITRRRNLGTLSQSQTQHLIAVCLSEQERTTLRDGITQKLVDMLGAYCSSGTLTPAQTDRFFKNGLTLTGLRTRPLVVAGSPSQIWIDCRTRMPRLGLDAWVEIPKIRIADTVVYEGRGGGGANGCRDSSSGLPIRLEDVGRHVLAVDVRIVISDQGMFSTAEPLFTSTVTLTAPVEVLAEAPPDYIKHRHSRELDAAVLDGVRVTDIRVFFFSRNRDKMQLSVHFDPRRPIGLAFEVFGEFDGRTVSFGFTSVSPSTKIGSSSFLEAAFDGEAPESMDIVLRASDEAATQTVDLFEIWDGALRFDDVTVLSGRSRVAAGPFTRDRKPRIEREDSDTAQPERRVTTQKTP